MPIADLIPPGLSTSPEQNEVVLEIAYLVTAVDGRLADEELEAFAVIAARLQGKDSLVTSEVDELIARFADRIDPTEIEARVKVLAPRVPKDLQAVVYRLALGLAFVDHDPREEEDRLHKVLGDAFSLTPQMRAAIARQVTLGGAKAR